MDLPDSFNSILFATMLPTSPENLIDNFYSLERSGKAPDLLLQSMGSTLANLQADHEPGQVFTDDLAPIEWITNSMVINFLLSGGAEQIQ